VKVSASWMSGQLQVLIAVAQRVTSGNVLYMRLNLCSHLLPPIGFMIQNVLNSVNRTTCG
jgi:hypothetical protein